MISRISGPGVAATLPQGHWLCGAGAGEGVFVEAERNPDGSFSCESV